MKKYIMSCTTSGLQHLYEVNRDGWPDSKSETPFNLRINVFTRSASDIRRYHIKGHENIFIPPHLRAYTINLRVIHETHLDIVKYKQRARDVIYWPGKTSEIESMVQNCGKCDEIQNKQQAEPLRNVVKWLGCD